MRPPAGAVFSVSPLRSQPPPVVTDDGAIESSEQPDLVALSPGVRQEEDQGEGTSGAGQALATQSVDGELSLEAYLKLGRMKARDTEVRAHEQAHLAAAGQYAAGGPSFSYQVGPDGRRYAVSGEVPVDISKGATPAETVRKMERIRAAALAPAQPSAADRQIAAQATMKASQARQEILLERQRAQPDLSAGSEAGAIPAPDGSADASPIYGIAPGGVQISVMIRRYNQIQDLKHHAG